MPSNNNFNEFKSEISVVCKLIQIIINKLRLL